MRLIIILACLLILLVGCSSTGDSEYIKTLKIWKENQQTEQYQKLQQEYAVLADNLSVQMQKVSQLEAELSGGQSQLAVSQNENARLNGVIASLPKQQVYDERWQELIRTRQALTDVTKRLEVTSLNFFQRTIELADLVKHHNSLLALIKAVNAKTDETTSTNLTVEKRQHFNEMWALWYEAENIGHY